jgi:hypothetical protein
VHSQKQAHAAYPAWHLHNRQRREGKASLARNPPQRTKYLNLFVLLSTARIALLHCKIFLALQHKLAYTNDYRVSFSPVSWTFPP